jgi:hypothetical protein
VAFRDKSGALGLLGPYCPHRGTSKEAILWKNLERLLGL